MVENRLDRRVAEFQVSHDVPVVLDAGVHFARVRRQVAVHYADIDAVHLETNGHGTLIALRRRRRRTEGEGYVEARWMSGLDPWIVIFDIARQ